MCECMYLDSVLFICMLMCAHQRDLTLTSCWPDCLYFLYVLSSEDTAVLQYDRAGCRHEQCGPALFRGKVICPVTTYIPSAT